MIQSGSKKKLEGSGLGLALGRESVKNIAMIVRANRLGMISPRNITFSGYVRSVLFPTSIFVINAKDAITPEEIIMLVVIIPGEQVTLLIQKIGVVPSATTSITLAEMSVIDAIYQETPSDC